MMLLAFVDLSGCGKRMSYPQRGDEALASGRPVCYLSLFSAARAAENRDKAMEPGGGPGSYDVSYGI